MAANWLQWLTTSPKVREFRETSDLMARVSRAYSASPLAEPNNRHVFLVDFIHEVCERRGITPSDPLGHALYDTLIDLLEFDGFISLDPEDVEVEKLTLEEAVALREHLNRQLRFIDDHTRLLPLWRKKLVWTFAELLENFPLSAFTDIDENGVAADDSVVLPSAKAFDLCDALPASLERLLGSFFDEEVTNAHLFAKLGDRLDRNILLASGLREEQWRRNPDDRKITLPTKHKDQDAERLCSTYLQGTPLLSFFHSPLPFAIPFPARFEHTHIVGGTGHGKTQLMQFLINHDLVRAQEDGRSIVVMDSQGDLIRTISRLAYFSPDARESLADRFVLVDPNDIEHPVCLNMFDFGRDRLSGYSALDREKILNATIELYEYFFGALLGADLTQRQGLIFRYLARLLLEIPDATIHTFRELMEDSERFRPYMDKLGGTARSFFTTQFTDRKFNETKKQILTRLWGVLSNSSLERMFSHTRNKVDVFELLNSGKIILINTAKDLLGQEGAAIFGRFFIALITQAAVQRSALPPHKRNPAFVYIDEAQDYFDDNISHLLNQARKYKVGLIFAHQNLDQLGAGLRSSVLASTSIKFAGGVSAKDASALSSEFRCDADFLLGQKKNRTQTEFACYVRNYTTHALSVSVPLGYVDGLSMLRAREFAELLETNRDRYSDEPLITTDREPEPTGAAPTPPSTPSSQPSPGVVPSKEAEHFASPSEPPRVTVPAPRRSRTPAPGTSTGRGGKQHKYLQHLVKQLAEERGFRATIEETILDGEGRVDVSLVRGGRRVACEISVTTGKDWELGNVEKCLAAGYDQIVLILGSARQVKTLSTFVEQNVDENDRGKIHFAIPESIVEFLDSIESPPQTSQSEVRGYKVKVTRQNLSPDEIATRRAAVASVIARSFKKGADG